MTIVRFVKPVIFIAGLLSMAAIFSRCSAGSSAGGAATTFAISGNMSVGQTAASISSLSTGVGETVVMAGDVNALATKCSDNYYYTVSCVSYSEPPVAAAGAVVCSGNTGSFTVSGLPLNSEIGCFIRRSADNASYSTLGTIEIPTTSLSGGTTTLVSQGNLNLAINLNTNGSITTVVTGGGDNVVTPVASGAAVDVNQYNGFWSVQCDATATGTLVDPVRCKCQNGGQSKTQYNMTNGVKNPSHISPEDACIADAASVVSFADTQQFVEINMYKASPSSSLVIENGAVIPAGTQIPVISVWGASSPTVSSRGSGGEGARSSVKDKNNATVNLTWSSAQATNAIAWAAGSVVFNGVTTNFASGASAFATALATPNAGNWKAWVTALYNASSGFTCTWGNNPSGASDAGCLSEFADRVMRSDQNINIPVVRIERQCGNSGCDSDPTHAIVNVDGYHVDYNGVLPIAINGVVLQPEGVSPDLRSRYVFEPFEATPTGGGFTQHHFNNRGYKCATAAGAGVDVVSAACDGANGNYVNCGIREEMSIKFNPTSATAMKLFFEQRGVVAYATLEKWNTGVKSSGSFTDALSICNSQNAATESRFQMAAVKQP